jgi:hypothetical protein
LNLLASLDPSFVFLKKQLFCPTVVLNVVLPGCFDAPLIFDDVLAGYFSPSLVFSIN